ncbi:rhamnogalacturonate lyase B isoform X3 [Syzygium oleosum]|uniref:rhamnogalacturonate lyase B isoform X3 n=1 Tax=Syzygium oleosum TaxID=219896 RepID=UPI0011D29EF8|nr:rhamnogalacturonate lyase B isoform X3 [Syzygium oleosum]
MLCLDGLLAATMEVARPWRVAGSCGGSFAAVVQLHCPFGDDPVRNFPGSSKPKSSVGVQLRLQGSGQMLIDNGLLQLTLSVPDGNVIGIQYNGVDNLLEILNEESNRGYWDVVWNLPGDPIKYDRIQGTTYKIVTQNEDQIELSFVRNGSALTNQTAVPLNIDKRYIVRRGCSGFYTYAIFDRPEGWPDIEMDQVRIVYKLQNEKFHFMALSDDRQRVMPMPEDRVTGQPLAYPEAVLLTNPINPELRGEVDDKYQYSCENQYNRVHGWISGDPPVGFWMITPSNEFRTAGPVKQDLTSHVGPITLSMFVSTHYAGKEVGMKFNGGEPWKKVFGPVLVYLNSVAPEEDLSNLWQNAKEQMYVESETWPYNFIESEDFPSSEERGMVVGQLLVRDRYITEKYMWGGFAYVGLASPGEAGSWQRENKGYQFWCRADRKGNFVINNIRAGDYNLYGWVPGIIGDYKYEGNVTITPGSAINLGILIYNPPRHGPTLWEIGVPDRTASEFYVPEPYPTLMNNLYTNNKQYRFRQYGLWERYADLYPENDLVFHVGVDDHRKDWFFAHVTRNLYNYTFTATTWKIEFELKRVHKTAGYVLQLALASVTESDLQVRFNDLSIEPPHFATGKIGQDNAIARHGIHGLYWLYSIPVPSSQLRSGSNTIFLTQARAINPYQGVMYDYIRLEGPPES